MYGNLWLGFLGGLFSFAHCLGMCGGFSLHLSQRNQGITGITNNVLWQAGRMLTYVFLGALAGYSGAYLKKMLQHLWLQDLVSITTGAVIVVMGIVAFGFLPAKGGGGGGVLSALSRQALMSSDSRGGALMLGIVTGCLPCPIVIGFLAYAAQTRSVGSGIATMAGMGLGTFIPLLLLGTCGGMLGKSLRRWGSVAGGSILVILGIVTMLRGSSGFHHILGCSSGPAQTESSAAPCCQGSKHGTHHQ